MADYRLIDGPHSVYSPFSDNDCSIPGYHRLMYPVNVAKQEWWQTVYAEPQSSQLPAKKQPPLTGVAIHDDKSVSYFSEANPHTTAPRPGPRNYVVPFVCTMMSNIALDPHSDPEVPAAASLVVAALPGHCGS